MNPRVLRPTLPRPPSIGRGFPLCIAALGCASLFTPPPAHGAGPGAGDDLQLRFVDPSWGDERPICGHALLPGPDRTATGTERSDLDPRYLEYDLDRVELSLRIDPEAGWLEGEVIHHLRSNRPALSAVLLDLVPTMEILSVDRGGVPTPVIRKGRQFVVALDPPLSEGEAAALRVRYAGEPQVEGFMGMEFGQHPPNHSDSGVPMVQTLSETNSAPAWWPCKDVAYDKFVLESWIEVPAWMTATGNGRLIETIPVGPDRLSHHWREDYPIATYLVAVNATNFVHWTDTYVPIEGDAPMPVTYYCYPESEAAARVAWERTPLMIERFARLFGEYPFVREQYGMVEFQWAGAMEHQTLSSYGSYLLASDRRQNERVVAHELAHQWWGDLISPGTWDDIWLNEGFATYCEALWYEATEGPAGYRAHMLSRSRPGGREFPGTIHRPDYTFNSTVYSKGAWVLHMLRGILGDELFFHTLREYRRNYAFGAAITPNFQATVERVTGRDLSSFFRSWVYGSGRPIYEATWTSSPVPGTQGTSGAVQVELSLAQAQAEPVFSMPISLVASFGDGSSDTIRIENEARVETYQFTLRAEPERIVLDPDDWILKQVSYVAGPSGIEPGIEPASLGGRFVVAPNPSLGPVRILFEPTAPSGDALVSVLDPGGRQILTLTLPSGRAVVWDGRDADGARLPAGIYWLRGGGAALGLHQQLVRIR